MGTYVMLTRLSPEALARHGTVEKLNAKVDERIREECPNVKWLANYAVLGRCDYLDIFEAPDTDALLVRSIGHASTETWAATPWERFAQMAHGLKV
jgi:uncharacterized protein with GYD domain